MRGWLTIIAVVIATGTASADDPRRPGGTVDAATPTPLPKPPDPDAPKQWDPVRWVTPEGTTVTFTIAAKRAEPPKLGITYGDQAYQLDMPRAFKDMVPAFIAIDDDVVITTGATPGAAWRYAWRRRRIVESKHTYWKTDAARPAWAVNAAPADATAALRRIAGLLRLTGTAPGLDQFFTDASLTWNVFTRGDKKPWKRTMTGKQVLYNWSGAAGYPILRGKLKIVKGCLALPANADGKPAAAAAPPDAPHLQRICVDGSLVVTAIDTLIAPEPGKTKPSPAETRAP